MKKWLGAIFFLYLSVNLFALDPSSKNEFWKIYTNALRGDKIAQFQVGVMYERGMGVDKNESMSALWYEKSAIQGYRDAQYNLGIMYASGRGVDLNDGFAMMWLGLAAKQGDSDAKKLVLDMINGTLNTPNNTVKVEKISDGTQSIKAVRLSTKQGAKVCDLKGNCTQLSANTTLTSKIKKGSLYKISGIGTTKGWEAYLKEGWISDSSVEIRR